MKRDDDKIREMLFKYEEAESYLFSSGADAKEKYHTLLMVDAGLMAQVNGCYYRMTNLGHDYLEAIRSDTVWTKVKGAASEVGGVTLELTKDLALKYLKQELATKVGVQL